MLLETTFTPTEKDEALFSFIQSSSFPWYYQKTTSLKHMGFLHTLLRRNEFEAPEAGDVNSSFYEQLEDIFKRICLENSIPVTTIFRAAINNNTYYPNKFGDIHVDHEFSHNNFLLFLNDFSDGSTYLFDLDNTITDEIKATKYKAVFFSGKKHACGFCAPSENRIVLVFTFI
jgi:hypothetical protein